MVIALRPSDLAAKRHLIFRTGKLSQAASDEA
jgi:hypothetical protein